MTLSDTQKNNDLYLTVENWFRHVSIPQLWHGRAVTCTQIEGSKSSARGPGHSYRTSCKHIQSELCTHSSHHPWPLQEIPLHLLPAWQILCRNSGSSSSVNTSLNNLPLLRNVPFPSFVSLFFHYEVSWSGYIPFTCFAYFSLLPDSKPRHIHFLYSPEAPKMPGI